MITTQARRCGQFLFLLACGPFLIALAQEAQQAKVPSPLNLFERYPEAAKLYQAKRYAEAAAILEPIYAAGPAGFGWYWNSAMYDLACYEAQAGRKQKALEVLTAWQARGGSVSADDLAKDTDLKPGDRREVFSFSSKLAGSFKPGGRRKFLASPRSLRDH